MCDEEGSTKVPSEDHRGTTDQMLVRRLQSHLQNREQLDERNGDRLGRDARDRRSRSLSQEPANQASSERLNSVFRPVANLTSVLR